MKYLTFIRELGSFNTWRHMVNFWTFVFFTAIVYDFFNANFLAENDVLLGIAGIYGAFLAIYSAEKEFRRWHHMHEGMHPGEVYSIMWTVLVLFIVIASVVLRLPYHMPAEVSASYIAVIGILAITRESKNYYKRKKHTSRE